MADVVQYRMESMLNELDDLEKRGLFNRVEIAEIVKQRRKFEYRLKRPSPVKQDFLDYVEYETQLDSLRLLRKKSMNKRENKKMKKSVSDFAGISRIIGIYRSATMRYKGDLDLWFRYLEFCRQKRNGRMKKVLAQVIRYHPKVPGVYIYAAAWEFDQNLNVEAARALMQHGLRVCRTSEDLWVEYLRMELTYLNKLKARKVALGEDEGTLVRKQRDAGEDDWEEENKELHMSVEKIESNDESDAGDNGSDKVDLFQQKGWNIFQAIYNDAIEALPSNFSLRKRFIEILEATNVAHSEEMREEVLNHMKKDFSKDPNYWDWLARTEFGDPKSFQEINEKTLSRFEKATEVYEEGLKFLPKASLFDFYIEFLKEIIDPSGDEIQSSCSRSYIEDYISLLLTVYEKAEAMGCMTEDIACQHISLYLQLGRQDEARKLSKKFCEEKFPDSVKLWFLYISVEIRSITRNFTPSNPDVLSVFELLKTALEKMPPSEAESLWVMALKNFSNQKHYFDKLLEISLVSLAKYGGSDNGFSLSSAIVDFILQKDGIKHARDVYKRFLALPRPGLSLYMSCIQLEENLASIGDKDCLKNARKLYETALATYNQNVGLWKDYYSMEIKMGEPEKANAVHWRAKKMLKDASALVLTPWMQ